MPLARLTAVFDAGPLVDHLALDVRQAADADVWLVWPALQQVQVKANRNTPA
jgi:hypothetical protein